MLWYAKCKCCSFRLLLAFELIFFLQHTSIHTKCFAASSRHCIYNLLPYIVVLLGVVVLAVNVALYIAYIHIYTIYSQQFCCKQLQLPLANIISHFTVIDSATNIQKQSVAAYSSWLFVANIVAMPCIKCNCNKIGSIWLCS